MAQIRVVFLHEPDHAVVPEPYLLQLVLREVVRVVPVRVLEPVEHRLGELLGFPASVSLRRLAKLGVRIDSAVSGGASLTSSGLLLAPAGQRAQVTRNLAGKCEIGAGNLGELGDGSDGEVFMGVERLEGKGLAERVRKWGEEREGRV